MAFRHRQGGKRGEYLESSEINVTPFIDVMLVLLIIFMVAAPLATVDLPLDLPISSAKAEPPTSEPIVLSIQADRSWAIGEIHIEKSALGSAIDPLAHGDHSVRIFVRADKTIPYEALMQAMDALRAHGYLKISLVGLDAGKGE
jgi:TonB system transport protein ExbD (group 1)